MLLELSVYSALCATEAFVINGVGADSNDFGKQEDVSPETAEPYGCGDMQFTPSPPTSAVLNKYKITRDEYGAVSRRLEEPLGFGECNYRKRLRGER